MKALRSALYGADEDVAINCNSHEGYGDPFGMYAKIRRQQGGYTQHFASLGFNTWHLVMVSRAEGVLPCLCEEALWQELKSSRFNTPLLRQWAPWLFTALQEKRLLVPANAWGCSPGVLSLDSSRLDRVVQVGLRDGKITI